MQNVDIIIIGGGISSLALACGLQGSGLCIVVLESNSPKPVPLHAPPELRVSAINIASEKLLSYLGVWSEIISYCANCYHGMEIWDKDGFGRIIFNDIDTSYNHLGYIVENRIIYNVLRQKAQKCCDVMIMTPVQIQKVTWSEKDVSIVLQNGDMFTARLIIGADDANSWIRNKADIPLIFWDYRYTTLVATVHTTLSHNNIVWQVFHTSGILVFLPLSDSHLSYIIWSLEMNEAQRMLEVTPKIFNQELCVAFDNRLGVCTIESERQIFSNIGCYAQSFASHRLALVGNAAHTIYPLVGQDINLSFMDVAKLIEELRRLHYENKDIGQYIYLRCYERSRKYNAAIMLAEIQGFLELFSGSNLAKKLLRNIGLYFANTLPCVKAQILCQIIGFNDLPEWLR